MLGSQPHMAASIMRNAPGFEPQFVHQSVSHARRRHAGSAQRAQPEPLYKCPATFARTATCHAAVMCRCSALAVSWWPPAVWHEPTGRTGRWQPLRRCHGLHAVQPAHFATRALQCIDAHHSPQERARRFNGFWMGRGHLQVLARRL